MSLSWWNKISFISIYLFSLKALKENKNRYYVLWKLTLLCQESHLPQAIERIFKCITSLPTLKLLIYQEFLFP